MGMVYFDTATTINGWIADENNSLAWLFAVPNGDEPDDELMPGAAAAMVEGSTTYQWLLDTEDVLAHPEPPTLIVEYGNAAAQLAAVGASVPGTDDGEGFSQWGGATLAVGVPIVFGEYARTWPEDYFGFRIVDVDESLAIGDPPDRLIVLRGRFDRERVVDAWRRAGYAEYQEGTSRAWSMPWAPV